MHNVNVDTGIRYGVSSHCQGLIEEITTNGTDESFEAYKRNCVKQMTELLEEHGQRDAETQAEDIVGNYEWDNYQCDEPNYSYEDSKGNKFTMGYLGGAPLVWCIQTSAIVYASRLCSPCVPNAADLDSGLVTDGTGYECYGIPTEYLDEEEEEEEDGERFDGMD